MRRFACLAVLLAACSGNLEAVDPPSEQGALPGASPDFDPGTLPEVQGGPGAPVCAQGQGISQVLGRVQEDSGLSLQGAKVQLCVTVAGVENVVCLRPVDTDQTGSFRIDLPDEANCIVQGAVRVTQPGAAAATTYCELPMTPVDGVVSLARPLMITRTTPAVSLPAAGGTVEFVGGVSVEVTDPSRLFGADDPYNRLGMRVVDPNDPGVCRTVGDPLAFDGMLAFSPELDVDGAGFDVRIQTSLAPLTPVAMYVKGGLNCSLPDGTHPAEAEWHDFGTGIVDDQGVLHATGENALPCLGWLAYFALDGPDGSRVPPPNEGAPPPLPGDDDPPLGEDQDDQSDEGAIPPPPLPPPQEDPEDEPTPPTPPPPADPPEEEDDQGGGIPTPPAPPADCNPPQGNPSFANGDIMPPLAWADAQDANGNQVGLDLGQLHCDDSIKAFVIVAGTGWCSACPNYFRNVAQQAQQIVDAGGVIIWMELEDNSYNPPDSASAARISNRYVGNAPGFRVGDRSASPSRVANARIIRQYPSAWVVQRSDMRIIADQTSSGGWMLDFPDIVRNAR